MEPSRSITPHDPTFPANVILPFCVTSTPGAVPLTSTMALTNATLPCALKIAEQVAALSNPGIGKRFNIVDGGSPARE